jgi:hypothetical protein
MPQSLTVRKVATRLSDVKEAIETLADHGNSDEIFDLADNDVVLRKRISDAAHVLVDLIAEAECNFEDTEEETEDEDQESDDDED